MLDEMYGDFEDLETGEVHKANSGKGDEAEVLGLNQHSYIALSFLRPLCCICVCLS